MSDLEVSFQEAAERATQLPERPSNQDLLKMYALYKQSTTGDVQGKRPGFMDMAGRAKYDAWADLEGMTSDDAKQAYIAFIDELSRTTA